MQRTYREEIAALLKRAPFQIDLDIQVKGAPPNQANTNFRTNRAQGDWAEQVVLNAINQELTEYRAVKYGRSESLDAGEPGFEQFYREYQEELNSVGKKPDVLIFRRSDVPASEPDLDDDSTVSRALAAIEVRSSSFLCEQYNEFMRARTAEAVDRIRHIRQQILTPRIAGLLRAKSPELLSLIQAANDETFRELDFRYRSWSSSQELKELSTLLRDLKKQIETLHKRDHLSITPKLEDLALVNRWIQRFNVPHFYLQVFFDKAYVIPFMTILEIASDPSKEGSAFTIEEDVKNQHKTTIKMNPQVGSEILGRIVMPDHHSVRKLLERGRVLHYVAFTGGRGYLDSGVFEREIIRGR